MHQLRLLGGLLVALQLLSIARVLRGRPADSQDSGQAQGAQSPDFSYEALVPPSPVAICAEMLCHPQESSQCVLLIL